MWRRVPLAPSCALLLSSSAVAFALRCPEQLYQQPHVVCPLICSAFGRIYTHRSVVKISLPLECIYTVVLWYFLLQFQPMPIISKLKMEGNMEFERCTLEYGLLYSWLRWESIVIYDSASLWVCWNFQYTVSAGQPLITVFIMHKRTKSIKMEYLITTEFFFDGIENEN